MSVVDQFDPKLRNIAPGADSAQSTRGQDRAENIEAPVEHRHVPNELQKSALRLSVQRAPLRMATLASIPAACGVAFMAGGYSLYDTIHEALLHPDGMTVMATLATAVFGLYVADVVSSIGERSKREARDEAADARHKAADSTQVAIMRAASGALEEMRSGHGRMHAAMEAHGNYTHLLAGEVDELRRGLERLREQQAPRQMLAPNSIELWSNFAPGSTCYNMGGQGRLDLLFERRTDGTLVFKPNWDRLLQTWYLRFKSDSAVAHANIIVFMGDKKSVDVPDQLATHLVIFRCIKILAERLGSKVDLSRAQFYLVYGRNPYESVFIGEQLLSSGERRPFAYRYGDQIERYAIPGVLQDDRVWVSHEAGDIERERRLVDAVMANQPGYSYEELEARFGHRVIGPKLPEHGIFGSTDGKPATFARHKPGNEIANGDHMSI